MIHAMNLAALDLNLLLVFDALMKERNVTRAAGAVGLSQPALSNALARLRGQLGDRLFVRGPRAMLPTPRALALAPAIGAALDHLRAALDRPAFDPATARAAFQVAATDEIELALVPALVRRLAALAPGVTLRCHRLDGIFLLPQQELQSGAYDLAIGAFARPAPVETGFFFHELYRARYECLARAGHPGVRGRFDLARFCALAHVATFYRGEPGFIDRVLAERGRKRRVALAVPHWLSVPFVVARSDLIATVPAAVAAALAPPLRLRRLRCPVPLPPVHVSVAWHARTHDSPAHRWLRDLLLAAARARR
jgi:DNA-binding transcriptional LysR family regulator